MTEEQTQEQNSNYILLDDKLKKAISELVRDRGLAPSSIELYVKILKKIFKSGDHFTERDARRLMRNKNTYYRAVVSLILEAHKYILKRPDPLFYFPRRIKTYERKIPKTYSIEEIKKIISFIPKEKELYRLMIRAAFEIGAGLRFIEVINMRWNDIKWVEWVEGGRKKGTLKITSTKRNKSFELPIPENLMEDLFSYHYKIFRGTETKEICPEGLRVFHVPKNKDYVFDYVPSDKYDYETDPLKLKHLRKKISYKYFLNRITRKYINPKLDEPFHFHSLRHSKASLLFNGGERLEIIKEMLGHSKLETSLIYTKINNQSKMEAIDRVPSLKDTEHDTQDNILYPKE